VDISRDIGLSEFPACNIVFVSDILKLAFEKASEVMSESEQEVFARWLLDALDRDDMRWDKAFAESAKKLESIADEVLEDFRQGRRNRWISKSSELSNPKFLLGGLPLSSDGSSKTGKRNLSDFSPEPSSSRLAF
jgi:hypothetical protein